MSERRFLLDTNVLSDLVRNPQGRVTGRIAEFGEHTVATSVVVAVELRFGAVESDSRRLLEGVELILSAFEILPLTPRVSEHYATIRWSLQHQGRPIGPNDFFIAAHARSMGLVVVTANVGELGRVPDLRVENWLESD